MVAARYSGYRSRIGCEIDFRPSSDLVEQRKQDDEKSLWKLVEESPVRRYLVALEIVES